MPFAIDGTTIHNILSMRRLLRIILFGKPNTEAHTMEGTYMYEGQAASLHTLVRSELRIQQEYKERRKSIDEKYIVNREGYEADREAAFISLEKRIRTEEKASLENHDEQDIAAKVEHRYNEEKPALEDSLKFKYIVDKEKYLSELEEIEFEFKAKMKPLQTLLETIKKDYHEATGPFMQQAHGIKKFLFKLIKESCAKRGRLESFLMQWGKIREEEEHRVFESYVTTLQRMDEFCTDLCNFFEDLVNSCPKGWKQFQELYHNNHK